MTEAPFSRRCAAAAARSRRQAWRIAWPVLAGLLILVALPALPGDARPALAAALAVAALAAGFAALALSVLLLFDAVLFAWMTSFPDEVEAGAAVDRFLAAAKLKPAPVVPRRLAERIAGTARLARRQLLAFALFVLAFVLAMAAKFA